MAGICANATSAFGPLSTLSGHYGPRSRTPQLGGKAAPCSLTASISWTDELQRPADAVGSTALAMQV
jgi:hypothetical protein